MENITENKINIDDFVWAKMKGFPTWPARVVKPGPNVPPKPTLRDGAKAVYWIYFFGTHNYAWIEEAHIKPYEEFKEKFITLSKTIHFKEAVAEIEEVLNNIKEDPEYVIKLVEYIPPTPKKKTSSVKRTLQDSNSISSVKKKRKTLDEDDGKSSDYEENATASPIVTLNSEDMAEILKNRPITTSCKVFGFLGLGIMGSGIVKNLITSGHRVNIWNRTLKKCDEMDAYLTTNEGYVKTMKSQREVVQNSDIIFSCLSDPETAKKMIQKDFGIEDSSDYLLEGKGFVEMTGIDPETSKDICEMVEGKGGSYLECQVQGSKSEAQEGSLIILTAGDKNLYLECQSCFKAMGKSSYFLGSVGFASQINLIIQLIKGICLVGLTEGLALADRCDIAPDQFISIFNSTNLTSPYLKGKADIIAKKKFNQVEQALQYMQKDIKLGLDLSNRLKQPMVMASAANEVFKHARRLGYDGHDASCIYMRTRH